MPTFTIPENVTRLGLYWYPRSTMNATGMLQFGFTSMELGSPFKSINLVFTFPELSLQPVTFHWYDMQPDGQLYYATSADTGAMELWDRIAGYPGEPLGFNIEVVKS